MTYEKFVKQLDGCAYVPGGFNCTAASEAMWLFRASQGKINVSSCTVRGRTGDRSGGLNLEQARAVSVGYGIPGGVVYRPIRFDNLRNLLLTGRYGTHYQIGYSQIAGTQWDCFRDQFRGGHDWYISGGDANHARVGDPGADGRPGVPNGFQSIPWDIVERAGGALPLGNGQTLAQEGGSGIAYAYVTPADPIVVLQKYRVTIAGPTTMYAAPNGAQLGTVKAATYTCTRAKVQGIWWYHILPPHASWYFKPNGFITARYA